MEQHEGVTAKGQSEVINLAKQIEKMVMREEEGGIAAEGAMTEGKKKIFKNKPCFTFDNFFFWGMLLELFRFKWICRHLHLCQK